VRLDILPFLGLAVYYIAVPGGIKERYDHLEGMPAPACLDDIIEALELQMDDASSFLDRETGMVETVSGELLREAEYGDGEPPHFPDWQKQEWEVAKQIVSSDRFLSLPTKFDVHEWEIMQDFSRSVKSDRIGENLLQGLHSAGAFRHFKETVRRSGLETAWYAFRAEALRQIAINWCEENQIAWE
jgi:hypothetical protein